MSVRSLSAQPPGILGSFVEFRGLTVLKLYENCGRVSSPKAKVTRSNRVGCAKTDPALAPSERHE
jgi:hypothetical protein